MDLSTQPVPFLIERFRAAATAKGDFSDGPSDAVQYAEMSSAFRELVKRGGRGNLAFERLLEDESIHVRLWAAAQLLFLGFSDARPVLERIASDRGLAATSARMTLEQFDAGRLGSPLSLTEPNPPS